MEHYTWDDMPKEILSPTIARKIISGDKAMVSQVFLAKGAIVPEHFHESEQITYIFERAAPRGGARRHARPGYLQPHPSRLVEEGRRLPARLMASAITHFIVGAA